MKIRIEGVVKRFGAVTAADRADLTVEDGELFTLCRIRRDSFSS